MRLPLRRAQVLKKYDERDEHLTISGIARFTRDLDDLKHRQKPQAIADVSEAVQKGDLSENAEYREARSRLSRIEGRIFSLTERLKNAIPIVEERDASGRVRIGSTVVLDAGGTRKTFQIVGSQETNPSRGRISHNSPLGSALIGHAAGERVAVAANGHETSYLIIDVE